MKTIETTRKRFSNASLEALLNTAFETLLSHIKLKAEQLGRSNLPRLINDSMKSYWEAWHHEYQALIDTINTTLQCQVTCFEVVENDRLATDTIRDLEHKLSDAEHESIPIENEVKNTTPPNNRRSILKARICICLVACFDTLLNCKYFQLLGNTYAEAVGIGIFFAAVLVIFAHLTPKIILRFGKTVRQQKIIATLILAFMTVVFWFLACLRSDYLNANGTSGVHYSPWFFTILSLFLFAVAVFAYLFLMPSKADTEAIERYNSLVARQQHCNCTISDLTAQINTARKAKSDFRVDNSSIVLYGNMLEKQAINQAKKGYATMKDELLRFRTDHAKPDCFDDEYPFNFNRNFDQID